MSCYLVLSKLRLEALTILSMLLLSRTRCRRTHRPQKAVCDLDSNVVVAAVVGWKLVLVLVIVVGWC